MSEEYEFNYNLFIKRISHKVAKEKTNYIKTITHTRTKWKALSVIVKQQCSHFKAN